MASPRKKIAAKPALKDASPLPVTVGDIARRAYALYLARGRQHGHDLDDWLRAERELKDMSAAVEA